MSESYTCSSCARSAPPSCRLCYRELVETSREWANENLALHKQVGEMARTIEDLRQQVTEQ